MFYFILFSFSTSLIKGEKAVPGSLDPVDPDGSSWILWCLLDPMVPTGSYGAYWILWCLLDSDGAYWILMDPDGSY